MHVHVNPNDNQRWLQSSFMAAVAEGGDTLWGSEKEVCVLVLHKVLGTPRKY